MALINICHGCLSVDRQLFIVEEHAKLYRQLLLKKFNTNIMKLMMCWECHKTLNNIHTFRMKITQAQKLLQEKTLSQHNILSNLTVVKKVDDYHIIIYEDEKINKTLAETVPTIVKVESCDANLKTELEIKNDDLIIKEELGENDFDDADDKGDITLLDDIDDKDDITQLDDTGDKDDITLVDDTGDKGDITQLDEVLVPIDLLEKKTEIKVEQGRKKRCMPKKKYRTVMIMDDIPDKRKFYDVIKIDLDTIKQDMEKKKVKSKRKFQCQRCYNSFSQQKFYERHLAMLHNQVFL